MACCFCGSDSHERESCPWYGTGKRVFLAAVLVLAVGCTAQKQQAVQPKYMDRVWSANIKQTMVACSEAVMIAAEETRAAGVEVTPAMMQRAYDRCLLDQGVTI